MPDAWIVLLEAAGDIVRDPIDADDLNELHEALDPGRYGGLLVGRDRYALQVTTRCPSPVEALLDVVSRWTEAVRHLQLPAWKLVRTEVFTPEDLEREFERAEREENGVHPTEAVPVPMEHDEIGHELLRLAFSDPLTGLLGREVFLHRLNTVLAGQRAVALISLDLDGFQCLNQTGGVAGDEILIRVAQRLASMIRPGDALARLEGEKYGVLLEDSTEHAALVVAERMLNAVRLPMSIAGKELSLAASAGVTVSQPGDDGQVVFDNAEAALSSAKAVGGGPPLLYGSDVPHEVPGAKFSPPPP